MAVATWRVLAFGTLLASVALPASAQLVIGGSGQPNVEVNWGVLDGLGRQPTLADMMKNQPAPPQAAAPAMRGKTAAGPAGVVYKPYKAQGETSSRPAKAKAQAVAPKKKPAVVPASAKSSDSLADSHVAQLVQSAQKPEAAKSAGPVVSLPEVPAPVSAPAKPAAVAEAVKAPVAETKPQTIAAAPVPVPATPAPVVVPAPVAAPAPVVAPTPAATPAPVAVPAPVPVAAPAPVPAATLPPTALTPPPMPVAAPQQVASLPAAPVAVAPAASESRSGGAFSILFGGDSAALPNSAQAQLDQLAKRMRNDDTMGLQLLAFAEGDTSDPSKARRLSLSRALEVRKYLMDQGIRSTRIEVRALGSKLEGSGPADRVDAVVVSR